MTILQEAVNYDYLYKVKNDNESQQTHNEYVKHIEYMNDMSKKLIDQAKTNNFIISEEQDNNKDCPSNASIATSTLPATTIELNIYL